MKQYDAIILGFGKGGKTLAGTLAGDGRRVALVEQSSAMYGGTCINVGCIPSKSLETSAGHSARRGGDFHEKALRYTEAVAERARVTSMLRNKNYHKLADHPGIDVLTGRGTFTGENEIEVSYENGEKDSLTAPQIFINTGSSPRIPGIDGLTESRYVYRSDELMALEQLPKGLLVIGGGYIGMEFASMYSNFGAQVTVVQDGPLFLPREDRDIADAVLKRLENMGVEVLFETKTTKIADGKDNAFITVQAPEGIRILEAEAVLIATGRIPNTAGLGLEKAGVTLTSRGAVETDEHLRTSNPAIYAMGDVVGGLQFTYISLDDYRIVKSAILGDGSRTTENRGPVPYSVFLDPPFSRIGLTEQQAREQGFEVKIALLPAAAIPKAQVLRETDGLLKAVIDAKTDEILGAHLFCAQSQEMINILKVAMDAHMPYTALRDMIFTHPTMAESLNDLFSTVK